MSGPADSAQVPAGVPEHSRVLRVRCLWISTSNHVETWLIPSGTIRSPTLLQVNYGLTQLAPVTQLLVLCLVYVNQKNVTKRKQALPIS